MKNVNMLWYSDDLFGDGNLYWSWNTNSPILTKAQFDKEKIRTRAEHPYGYSPILIYKNTNIGLSENRTHGWDYDDRMRSRDYDFYNKKFDEAFPNTKTRGMCDKTYLEVETFLRTFFDNPDLELFCIIENCNISNGYPEYYFSWYY